MACNSNVTESQQPEQPSPPKKLGCGKPGRSGPPKNKNALKHGYYSLVKLVKSRHGALDKRTILGKMIVETVRQLTADRGGDSSTAEAMLIRDVAIDTLLLQALESRLDVAPIRKGKIHPVYTLRSQLIAQRREHLKLLGLKRVPKTIKTINELAAERIKQRKAEKAANTLPAVVSEGNGADLSSDSQEHRVTPTQERDSVTQSEAPRLKPDE